MRFLYLFSIIFIFLNSISEAREPDAVLFSNDNNSDTSAIAGHTQILLGFNATQVIVGDIELHAMLRFKKRYSIMAGAGYDLNFLDLSKPLSLEDQCRGCNLTEEAQSNAEGRYFWGNGAAFRLILSDTYTEKNVSHFFMSLYFLFKYHNYENNYYADGGSLHSESADQQIFGMGFYGGYEILKKNSIIRPYGGIGLRTLDSKITWPEIYDGQTLVYKGKHFTESYAYPAIDFGLIFLFGLRR